MITVRYNLLGKREVGTIGIILTRVSILELRGPRSLISVWSRGWRLSEVGEIALTVFVP